MTTRAVPCRAPPYGGTSRLIAAVVGFGDTGSTGSPISALASEDLPALNAPNSAIVNRLLRSRFALSRIACAAAASGACGASSAAALASALLRRCCDSASPLPSAACAGVAALPRHRHLRHSVAAAGPSPRWHFARGAARRRHCRAAVRPARALASAAARCGAGSAGRGAGRQRPDLRRMCAARSASAASSPSAPACAASAEAARARLQRQLARRRGPSPERVDQLIARACGTGPSPPRRPRGIRHRIFVAEYGSRIYALGMSG